MRKGESPASRHFLLCACSLYVPKNSARDCGPETEPRSLPLFILPLFGIRLKADTSFLGIFQILLQQ